MMLKLHLVMAERSVSSFLIVLIEKLMVVVVVYTAAGCVSERALNVV